jgi:glucose-1-phosphate adenylyltransferase
MFLCGEDNYMLYFINLNLEINVNDTSKILGMILGGGVGSRLYPLTKMRAKPAVPIGGKYRLIDIPLSNCINAGIQKIAVLTQFNSVSLHRHISRTYNFDAFHTGWVQILAAEQTLDSNDWYMGTADAVRKQTVEIEATGAEFTLILSGDHLYRMDYKKLAEHHWEMDADITVAVKYIGSQDASRFGLAKIDDKGRIHSFVEKPTDEDVLKEYSVSDNPDKPFLGSMGIYMFKTSVLLDLLSSTDDTDFGSELIPRAIHTHKVYSYGFDDYWQDIGTIRSFYDTNLELTKSSPPFSFFSPEKPIYTRPRFLPPAKIIDAEIKNSLISDGCYIGKSEVINTLVGLRAQISDGATIKDTIIMGADYYDSEEKLKEGSGVPLGIGEGSNIKNAILDKNVRIGKNVTIKPFPQGTEIDNADCVVRDGIVVIPKRAILPDGTKIGPK